MLKFKKINPMLRAIGVIGAVAAIATGVTFAALNSQATLTNDTITSGTAQLQVDNLDNGIGLAASDAGFAFTGVVPGGANSSTGNFQLRNNGDVNLGVTVFVPANPVFSVDGGADTVNRNKVHIVIQHASEAPQDFLLSNLLAAPQSLGNINLGTTEPYNVHVTMDADAFSGSSVTTTSGFNFQFDGTGL